MSVRGISVALTLAMTCAFAFAQKQPDSLAQGYGSISGTVTDEHGERVSDATVYAWPSGIVKGIIPNAATDSKGKYVLKHLDVGRYFVSAAKPQDDYPQLYLAFYGGIARRDVTLSASRKAIRENLKLRNRAGVVVGTVSDSQTGEPIASTLDLRCTDNPRRWLRGGFSSGTAAGRFRVFIPSDCPVLMKVSHRGYAEWSPTRNGEVAPIRLRAGEVLNLDIKLVKIAKTPPHDNGE